MAKFNFRGRRGGNPRVRSRGGGRPPSGPSVLSYLNRKASRKTGMGMRLRTRSMTQLAYRRKRNAGPNNMVNVAPGVAGQTRFNKTWRASPRVRTMEKVAAANYYSTNIALRTSALGGFQEVASFDVARADALLYIAGLTPTNSATVSNPKQFILESATVVVSFANNSLSGAHLDIWDVIYNRDTTSQYNNVSAPSVNQGALKSDIAWKAGLQDQTFGNPANAYATLMTKPQNSRLFRDYCRALQTKRIMLASGSTHEHRIKLNFNKLVDTALINNVGLYGGTGIACLQNLTYSTLYAVYGMPASSGSQAGGSLVVSTAPVALDIVFQVVYKYTYVSDNTNSMYEIDNLSSFIPGAQNIVNVGGAVIQATANTNP